MAITILSAPSTNNLHFAGDYLMVTASTNNVQQNGFRYRLRVFLNSASTAAFTTFIRPNTSGKLVVDVSDIVLANMQPVPEDTHGSSIFESNQFQIVAPSHGMHVKVELQEYYQNAVQGSPEDRTFRVIKGYGKQSEGPSPDRSIFKPKTSGPGVPSIRVLHHDELNEEGNVEVPFGHPYLLGIPFENFTESHTVNAVRFKYGSNTDDLTVSDLSNMPTATASFTDGSFYYLLDINPQYWAAQYGITGSPTTVAVSMQSTTNNQMMHIQKITRVEQNARKNPWVSFTFLNDLGGYDFLLMDGRLKVQVDTEHQTMSQDFQNFSTDGSISKYTHNLRSFSRKTTTTYTIRKTHLEDVEVKLAKALQRAELVYMKVDGEDVKPVTIESVNFDFNTVKTAALRPCTVRVVEAREERC